MEIVDANIVLRYFLKDNKELFEKAKNILDYRFIHLPFEVIAEVVYVLDKVYKVPHNEIANALTKLINYVNISIPDFLVLEQALKIYTDKKLI